MSPAVAILLVGGAVAASCALLGTFLVLRRLALLGDAISHSVLPGIAIAFLLTGTRNTLPMLAGAGALGVLTVFLVEALGRSRRVREDASIGLVFPALFSIGVILVSRFAYHVDLDLDCVLYGEIAYAPLDLLYLGATVLGPKALWVNGAVLLLNAGFVILFFKELKVTTFDPELSFALGFSPLLMHYALMSAVSITVVGAFESVGAILVLAMLVGPPAAAYMLTDRLERMLVLAVAAGIFCAVLGYYLARWWDASIAGSMAVACGLVFTAAHLFSPRHGLLTRWLRHLKLRAATSEQLLLLHLQQDGRIVPLDRIRARFSWGRRRVSRVTDRLVQRGWVEAIEQGLRLTAAGAAALERSGQLPLRHRGELTEDPA